MTTRNTGLIDILFLAMGAVPAGLIRWQLSNSLLVNVVGSGLLGFFLVFKLKRRIRLILAVGFCGSFTTFSGFIFDCFLLIKDGLLMSSLALISMHLIFSLIAAILGMFLGKSFMLLKLF